MEIQEALEVIRKLADGLHPETAEPLRQDSLYQMPLTVRALNRAVLALEFQQQKERTRKLLPPNAGRPWSQQEDQRLVEELRHGTTVEKIAANHQRRVGSIVARLIRLKQAQSDPVRKSA